MKPLSKLTFALLLSLITAASYAQTATSKPKIFAAFPNTINCPVNEFSNVFTATEGQRVVLAFSDNFKFAGIVKSNITKYNNLQSIIIKSESLDNTIFHLSKQINSDNSISYVGRIMSSNASDGYEIKKDVAGNYKFEKLETERVLQECNNL